MNLKEIQENAPKRATHYYINEFLNVHYLKMINGDFPYTWVQKYMQWMNLTEIGQEQARSVALPLYPNQETRDPTNPSHYKQGNSHYFIDVSNLKEIDFYVIARLYGITDPNIQHVIKKLLAVGKRNGGKSAEQDIQECIDSLNRKLEIDKSLEKLK